MWVPLSNCLSQNMLFFFSFFGEGGNAKSHNIKVILTVQKQYLHPYFFHMTWQPGAENQMHFINWSSASVSTYKRRIFWHCVLIQCHELELQSSPDLEMKLHISCNISGREGAICQNLCHFSPFLSIVQVMDGLHVFKQAAVGLLFLQKHTN